MRHLRVVIVLLLFSNSLIPQEVFLDSVLKTIRSNPNDQKQLGQLLDITQQVMLTSNSRAIILLNYGIAECKRTNNPELKVQFQSLLGYCFKNQGDFKNAVETLIDALQESDLQKSTDRSALIADNLASTFLELGKTTEAHYYYLIAIKNGQQNKNKRQLSITYTNFGYLKAELQEHDSALYYYKLALPQFEIANDSLRIADIFLNIGRSLISLKQANEAERYLNKAEDIFNKFNDRDGESRALLNLADLYILNKNYDQALQSNIHALAIARELQSDFLIDYCYQGISECYQLLGDDKNALEYFKKHTTLSDSINSVAKHEQIIELEKKYQSNLKDKELLEDKLALSKKEKERQLLFLIVIASAFIIALLVYLYYKLKNLNTRLQVLLEEKDFLMHEIHHRIKNNLQLLGSLMELQLRNASDEKVISSLKDSQSRITAIATLHAKLYNQDHIGKLQLDKYLSDLCMDISQMFGGKKIELVMEMQPIELSVEKGIIIGLITNEIITNSLKHAFSSINHPVLKLKLFKHHNEIELVIGDNGNGLPEVDNHPVKTTLGIKVIHSLSRQLGARVQTNNHHGLEYKILIPLI